MLKEFYEGLYGKLELELQEQESGEEKSIRRLMSCVQVVRKYLRELQERVLELGFAGTDEEVWFFKEGKPRFYRWLIYYFERFGIEEGIPLGDEKSRLAYYAEQLQYLSHFLRQHEFYYQYYKLGATELDHLWFVRDAIPGNFCVEVPDVNPLFGTAQDYLFSKFMAYELLRSYLLDAMAGPAELKASAGLMSRKGVPARWTGDTCNLIEVIYGIYETRQVNEGEVDLSDLVDVFEQVFQVNLSRYFRRFTEIKRRKTISKTKFLDQMRDAVNKRIDDGDALIKPVKAVRHPFLEGNKYL